MHVEFLGTTTSYLLPSSSLYTDTLTCIGYHSKILPTLRLYISYDSVLKISSLVKTGTNATLPLYSIVSTASCIKYLPVWSIFALKLRHSSRGL